ncbi:MAG TPA: ABC transporter permease [Trebonia sp.]|jgi:NitT/TauT family transport system permease protein|nr:ABC transporter permease [Trebonia sp.]
MTDRNGANPEASGTMVESGVADDSAATPEAADAFSEAEVKEAWYVRYDRFLIGLAALLVVAGAWQLFAALHIVNPSFTSSPSKVAVAEYHYFVGGTGWSDVEKTGLEFILGLAIAILVGIPVGLIIGWYPLASAICEPFLNLIYATPFVALAPLFVLWFGIGLESKLAVVFLAAVVSIVVTTSAGVKTVENSLLGVARTYRANSFQIFRTLVLPGTLPSIVSGVRLGTGHALTGAVLAELIASTGGVGYFINASGTSFDTDQVFAGIAVIAFAGLIVATLLRRIERKFDKWRIV